MDTNINVAFPKQPLKMLVKSQVRIVLEILDVGTDVPFTDVPVEK